jgi:pimeloyl-ACP methyl ester carboxylesterase
MTRPAVVLLPGLDGGVDALDRLRARLPGPVVSVGLPRDPTLDSLDGLAGAVSRALPRGPVVVFGASLGGLVGRALARRSDGRVIGLVTLGALPSPARCPPGLRRVAALAARTPPPVFAAAWRRRLERRMTAEGIDLVSRGWLLRDLPGRDVALARLRAVLGWRDGAAPGVPTVWLRGQTDTEAPWTAADARADLPGVPVSVVPGGHRAHWTHPGPVAEVVRAMVASTR